MNDKFIQLKSRDNNDVIEVYPYTKAGAILFNNGKTLEEQISNHNHTLASASTDGFLSKEDYLKLLNIEPNANKYYHPSTHDSSEIMHKDRVLSEVLEEGLNDPSRPSVPLDHTHSVDDIITTSQKMFISQAEKNIYADKYTKAESDAKYELKGQGGSSTVSGDISVNSITIGKRFTLMLNDFNELSIINAKTYAPLATLTADGTLVVGEIQEVGTSFLEENLKENLTEESEDLNG